ncbi:MAG: hypothetical protein ACD_81C00205G0002 [uncultured bacterium]|uniref:Uncharacterized protein n=1 Tax=Candidatus Wolfebacteria bacterium GW2011_GWC2_39_22 TaxID=1619013 RepID=A0A0G0N9M9_9BACT|nr:MAG: hypothetical protein ACD_81C00205G0002 [uncultured bacterium]KKR12138.1 MAG: hypothetical protein UT41_C0003G0065 [Candidatus Wolfebacteria bacterium GW2011_GWC2_39_22]HBI25241.1 hypothetical protein [Candidatus Wolfebacteria bacterium]
MLKRIFDAITGKREVVTLGLDKATAIFQEAKGKFDGSANKAVPFAIIATARALGAEVTLFDEGKQKATELASNMAAISDITAKANKKREALIAELRRKVAEVEETIKTEGENAVRQIVALDEEKIAVKEVVDFFTV